ncbi:MAG: DUF3623 domain-containing protein [Rubrivivax sp.]|nr:DUF3623 domain-containing protein [Rubrivivax sp.]
MLDLALAAGFAVFAWWFSTGLVLLLDGLPRRSFRWSLLVSSLIALAALFGIAETAARTDATGAYVAFVCALLVWGWVELSFLTGWITGPRKTAAPPGVRGWPRFVMAVQAILWHELAILAAGVTVLALTWQAANPVAAWTFVVLWALRTSAKLNLFFGVRNLSEEFLPPHLAYLQSFFRRRAMNAFFPLSVAAACWALAQVALAAQGADAVLRLSLTLAGTMLALAIVEHLLLVLPFRSTALWRWALAKHDEKLQHAR